MTVTTQQAIALLENVLFESTTEAAANAAGWVGKASSISALATLMASSPEESIAGTVVGFFFSALGRPPTAAEVQFYVSYAEKGLSAAQIAAGQVSASTWDTIGNFFTHSPEFQARAHIDNSLGVTAGLLETVPWLYQVILGRSPNNAEIAYYDNQVVAGAGIDTLFLEFTASPEFHTDTASAIAADLANYGAAVASGDVPPLTIAPTVTIGPPPPPPAPTPAPAPTFGTLTSSPDSINDSALTGAHTYGAILGNSATLNAGDRLTGNGLATLDIADNGTGSYVTMPGATLSGIATVKLTTGEDAGGGGGNAFDVSGVGGLTALKLNATGTGGDYVTVGSNVAVTASTHSTLFSLLANGTGNTLALTDSALTTLSVATLAGNVGTISLTTTGANTSLTLDIIDLTSLQFTDLDNHITTLVMGGGVNSDSISAISDSALTSLTLSAGEFLTFGSSSAYVLLSNSLTTLDTDGDNSNVYFNVGSATVAATFGAGSSFITGTAGSTITLESGVDSTGAVTVNGFDALIIAAHSYSSETLTGTGASVDITDSSATSLGVDGLTLTGTLTAGSPGLTLTGTSTASSLHQISDTALTTLTIGGDVTIGTLVDSASSLTITGSSTASSIGAITDSAITTLSLSGDVSLASTGTPFVIAHLNSSVTGSTDDSGVHLSVQFTGGAGATPAENSLSNGGSGSGSGAATITLGDGADSIVLGGRGGAGGAGSETLNQIGGDLGGDGGAGGAGGHNSVTLGGGANSVTIDSIGGTGGAGGVGENPVAGLGNAQGGNGGAGGDGGHESIMLGDGNNTVTDDSTGGNGGQGGDGHITATSGTDSATSGNGGAGGDGGHNSITVGNGNNAITDSSTGGVGGAPGIAENFGSGASIVGASGLSGTGGNDTITVGTGYNTIDLGGHGNDIVIAGDDAGYTAANAEMTNPKANVVIKNAVTGDFIEFANAPAPLNFATVGALSNTPVADLESDLSLAGSPGQSTAVAGTFGGNTYFVESDNYNALGPTHEVIIEVIGLPVVTLGTDPQGHSNFQLG